MGCSTTHLCRIFLNDDTSINHLIHSQQNQLHAASETPLVHVLPEDVAYCVEEAVQDRHQEQLVLLAAPKLKRSM